MRIITWNINGFTSALKSNCLDPIFSSEADMVCLQETKISNQDVIFNFAKEKGYGCYVSASKSAGHSGVCVFSRHEPLSFTTLSGNPRLDDGRFLCLDFGAFLLYNVYMLHGNRDKRDYEPKLCACQCLLDMWRMNLNDNRQILVATDFNIAHNDIDVCRHQSNRHNTMFTDRERSILDACPLEDAFRILHPDTIAYSWWPYAFHARERNIGWRIDYFFTSHEITDGISSVAYLTDISGSDHCPLLMEFSI